MYRQRHLFGVLVAMALVGGSFAHARLVDLDLDERTADPLTLVVMDPLCDRLACDCVEGYAQRKYEALGEYLGQQLNREVRVYWGESIHAALEETDARPDLVIGKHSVVISDASSLKLALQPVAALTGKDGSVTQTGLIVVRKNDPATSVDELDGYRIFFGPADCDEKYAAPMDLLRDNGVELPRQPEVSGACSEAATKLMELDKNIQAAAVISSYAEPLLSGCGTIEKGDLRVIGISDAVPFVTAFVNSGLPQASRQKIVDALMGTDESPELLKALESSAGFVPLDEESRETGSQANEAAATKKK